MCCRQKGTMHGGLMVLLGYEVVALQVCYQTHQTTDNYVGSTCTVQAYVCMYVHTYKLSVFVIDQYLNLITSC